MARKQAKRRKQRKTTRSFALPSIQFGRIVTPVLAVALIFATYQLSLTLMDREISSIEITGPFQRVSALQIEEVINTEIDAGFVRADLDGIRERITSLPWVDQARVARRWPSRLSLSYSEQVPAAVWGDSGLLNTRGELFVTDLRHAPAELPNLSGPESQSADVAKRYLSVREQLIPLGLDVKRLHLDARGAWQMTLQNGVEIRIGRRNVDERTGLFLDVVANIITQRGNEISYVDMRYGNGFTIGWKDAVSDPSSRPDVDDAGMLAARGTE